MLYVIAAFIYHNNLPRNYFAYYSYIFLVNSTYMTSRTRLIESFVFAFGCAICLVFFEFELSDILNCALASKSVGRLCVLFLSAQYVEVM